MVLSCNTRKYKKGELQKYQPSAAHIEKNNCNMRNKCQRTKRLHL